MPGPADAHDAGVYRTCVQCLPQLMLMTLASIVPVWNDWPS